MRILSLLPSATEIVFALDLSDSLVGVTAECDFPPAARAIAAVSFPTVGTSSVSGLTSAADIDGAVVAAVAAGAPLYRLDEEAIAFLQPDLILAQDLCRVCAVPSGDVTVALHRLGCTATVVSLDPFTLGDVIAAVTTVAAAAGCPGRGRALADALSDRVAAVRRRTIDAPPRRVLELEWSDPPFLGGHWVPEMVTTAGGTVLLAPAGEPSRAVTWDDIAGSHPEVVLFAPCGYGLAEAVAEGGGLLDRPELDGADQIWALDGSAYFSRPGPRVVDGVELVAWILHPDRSPVAPPGRAERLR
jgi:iron complex transport system substrate-binding protein